MGERGEVDEAAARRAEAVARARCQLCDDEGYRLPRRGVVCDHVNRQQTTSAGLAKVRAALSKESRDK